MPAVIWVFQVFLTSTLLAVVHKELSPRRLTIRPPALREIPILLLAKRLNGLGEPG